MSFRIMWSLSDDAWEQAEGMRHQEPPGSDYDAFAGGRFDLLYGVVQFRYQHYVLFPADRLMQRAKRGRQNLTQHGLIAGPPKSVEEFTGLIFSVFDIAYQLAAILDDQHFEDAPNSSRAVYDQSDGNWEIYFEKSSDMVIISSNGYDFQDVSLVVPEAEFYAGVQRFLRDIAQDIQQQAPELLDWHSLALIRQYL